jgi:DNA-binding transcriptional MerR regulator
VRASDPTAGSTTEYRVAELARAARTSVRNIRVYQDRGLLPPPRREGRIGLYTDAHLARLELIGKLLGRGYTFATIGELFDAWNNGEDLADTLGLREALAAPWTREKAVKLSRAEVSRRFGMPFSAAALERAVELGLLVPEGKDAATYLVPSPSLFDAGTELAAAGVPLTVVLDLAAAVQDDMSRVAQRFISVLLDHVAGPDDGQSSGRLTGEVAQRVVRLRPHAQRTVDALLLMAMQRETTRLLDQLTLPEDLADPTDLADLIAAVDLDDLDESPVTSP